MANLALNCFDDIFVNSACKVAKWGQISLIFNRFMACVVPGGSRYGWVYPGRFTF